MSSFTGESPEEPSFIVGDPILTNTDSRLDNIEQRLDTIEQLLTQQAQLADNSFASQGPLNFSDLVAQTNASFQSRSANTTRESSVSGSFGASVGGKNKTKSNKKKKSKNQTKRKRKV